MNKIPWVYEVLGSLLLAAVCVAGNNSYGAQLSLGIGDISFQPSKFVKITSVSLTATMFYRSTGFKAVLVTTAVAALHMLILVLSKDLGSALIFFITYLFMLLVTASSWFYPGAGTAGGRTASVLAYQLFSHVRIRVAIQRNPWTDIDSKGYQITQSLFVIGTDGWFGMGLYQGMLQKIPAAKKDFVFATISEGMGGVLASCVLLICLGCLLQLMITTNRMQAPFLKLLASGLGVAYVAQVILTVDGVTRFISSARMTLPLVSHGGSSIFATSIVFGVIQGLSILKQNEEEEDIW